ncbi:MAG: RICIN domain-containing protein [Fibrobacterales bacterium]
MIKKIVLPILALAATSFSMNYTYAIKNVKSQKCVEVQDAAQWDGANVQQYHCTGGNAQKWQFSEIDGDIHTIRNVETGKLLDVAWGGQSDNIQQWGTEANGDSQKWIVRQITRGTFNIRPVSNPEECIDVQAASLEANANIQRYACNYSDAQEFVLTEGESLLYYWGEYKITTKNADRCVEVGSAAQWDGANVQQWDCNGSNAQVWDFVQAGNHEYAIVNKNSQKFLDVAWGGESENVQQWGDYTKGTALNIGASQEWKIEDAGEGYVYFKPLSNLGECLEIAGGDAYANNGSNVQSVPCDGSDKQKFRVTK